jgi:peptidoglycan hydrolase-like amidase
MTRRNWLLGTMSASAALADRNGSMTISISVFGLFAPTTLEILAPSSAAVEVSADEKIWRIEGHPSVRVTLADGLMSIASPTGKLTADTVTASGRAGVVLSVPGRIKRRFEGRLSIRPLEDRLQALVSLPIESAVAAILGGESGQHIPFEALKAQAMVSRSYLLAAPRHREFDFCDTTHCQYLADTPAPDSPIARAVAATKGEVLTANGKTVTAMYSRSCSGKTVSSDEAGLPNTDYRFVSVECPICKGDPERWGSHLTVAQAAQVSGALDEPGRLVAAAKLGWNKLPSTLFEIGGDPRSPTIQGAGRGHGVGLCQRGAEGLANRGWNAERILAHYFPGSSIELARH